MSSLHVLQVECSILWINHLFQNGRALLKCRIFIHPTTGDPDVEKSRSHAPRYDTYVPIVNKHFKTVLNFSALFFVFRFRAFCVVVVVPLQPQFRQFAANHSSFSYYFSENSTGFDADCITLRFVSRFLCCCWVPLQPQFRHSSVSSFFPPFRNSKFFVVSAVLLLSCTPATVTFVFSNLSSFALCCQCCVVVEFHSSHSYAYAYAYANSRPHFLFILGWRKPLQSSRPRSHRSRRRAGRPGCRSRSCTGRSCRR